MRDVVRMDSADEYEWMEMNGWIKDGWMDRWM